MSIIAQNRTLRRMLNSPVIRDAVQRFIMQSSNAGFRDTPDILL